MNKLYYAPSQLVERPDFRDKETKGVMVGYAGHVPRARDKVGGSPLGHLPGTPVSPNGKVGIDMETGIRSLPAERAANFAQHAVKVPQYVSEARDLGKAGGVKPKLYGTDHMIPGYGGHKKEAKYSYGSSIYTNGQPQGNAESDNWSGKYLASTGHGASSQANWVDDAGLNTEGDVPVTAHGTI